MNHFVAIELDSKQASAVKSAAASLALFGKGSFCPAEGYHITLAFLGKIEDSAPVIAAMKEVGCKPFTLSLGELGSFGNTYYVGVEDHATLSRLATDIRKSLKSRGLKIDEKPFTPHITVARRFTPNFTPMVMVPSTDIMVKGISLMQTVGPGVYKRLAFISF